ncbi:MAG: phosphoribosyltransferase [Candidatus Eisenbacteria bacterium]|uniref:Phosphoribosyltransferase n=1 Tax=Eiseniibacteriota bacterium TaxID=2212470 RepID=A0A538TNZ4_UNCEI|nr:MAG: phosphoribosyltransferase [Candidatus Eisenbacteria bacterium]
MFRDRASAGACLADAVASRLAGEACRVYGLARGGVLVARPIAERLSEPLEVLVACKVGAPGQPELAVGAVSESGGEYWDEWAIRTLGLGRDWRAGAAAAAADEATRRVARYRGHPLAVEPGDVAVLVDDGIATGSTVLAALRGLARLGARRCAVAAPVASRESLALLAREAEWALALEVPVPLGAVGAHYSEFEPVADEQLLRVLGTAG